MNETDIIKGARELLSDPNRWHRGSLHTPDNTAFCAMGALEAVGGDLLRHTATRAAFELLEAHVPDREKWQTRGRVALSHFNDDRRTTHQDILNVFDKALADLGGLA